MKNVFEYFLEVAVLFVTAFDFNRFRLRMRIVLYFDLINWNALNVIQWHDPSTAIAIVIFIIIRLIAACLHVATIRLRRIVCIRFSFRVSFVLISLIV